MSRHRVLRRVACAAAAALLVASAGGAARVFAAPKGGLLIRSINVAQAREVPLDQVIEVRFSAPVDPASVTPATFQVRGQNAGGTGYTRQVHGEIQIQGAIVRFFPRLPTNLRDPADPKGGFYGPGTPLDSAEANAGFAAGTNYQVELIGAPAASAIRASRRSVLRQTQRARFSTSSSGRPDELYAHEFYLAAPPPQIAFVNPADRPASAAEQYAFSGGTRDVPTDVDVSFFLTQVPLSPATVRRSGGVTLTQTDGGGDASLRRLVAHDAYVEQTFSTTRVVVDPKFRLVEKSGYAVRFGKEVRDLTELYDLRVNAQRDRLRALYDFLAAGRAVAVGVPWNQIPDPPPHLIADWPLDPVARGICKQNILLLGDARPDEVDPRTALIFTTRDEPVTAGSVRVEFAKTEPLFDAPPSTADWDAGVPGAASAVPTAGGGTGADGDFKPVKDVTLSTDAFPSGVMNFRDVVIPAGVRVTVVGARPAVIRALTLRLDGTIDVSGAPGATGDAALYAKPEAVPRAKGGAGGPGGGSGGDASEVHKQLVGMPVPTGFPGLSGTNDTGGVGGGGGLPGAMAPGTAGSQSFSGAGGGGGSRLAGGAGQNGVNTNPAYIGAGGLGGAANTADPFSPLAGGGGGGAGANGATADPARLTWNKGGSAGGGGGGAILLQTAKSLDVGTTGRIVARGGAGGALVTGSYGTGGPGGGGGGGTVLLRSGKSLVVANPAAAIDVSGGAGGTGPASTTNYSGGAGGAGSVRIEDPAGGISLPGGPGGTYDPVGGGVPSVVYTKWIDTGPSPVRIQPFTAASVASDARNDALVVEVQMTRETSASATTLNVVPDLTALTAGQDSTNRAVTSDWLTAKVHDESRSTAPGGLLGVAGYDPSVHGTQRAFAVDALHGKGYRFIRFRVRFQLDPEHKRTDPVPYVDRIEAAYQTNN